MLRRVTDLYFLKMPVNAVQYRVTVGIFNNRKLIITLRFELPSCSKLSNNLSNFDPNYISLLFYIFLIAFLFSKGYNLKISTKLNISIFLLFNIHLGVLVWLYSCLIILSGDVEVNPGPKNSVSECLSICHWNLNSISADDYSKLFLLKAYISVHKFDIICLSETYLDSTVPLDDDNLVISGYNLIRSDHPSNTKRGGVCLYCKNYLPLRVLNISYLKECLNFELKISDKSCTFIALYRSPSQSQDDFETFSDNFEMTLETLAQKGSFLTTIIGDFNAKSCNWNSHDKTSFEGSTIESITSQFGLHQLINKPTHLLQSSSSCIDSIFTSQPNIIVESGVHPSLHPNCHHQIIFAKFNLKIYYPPPYLREVWHYKEANADLIKRAINNFNWEKAFYNTNINEKVSLFNKTILNILNNYIPHETIICDDKDPPWFNSRIKSLIENKNKIHKNYQRYKSNTQLLSKLNLLQEQLHLLINRSKQNYYSRMASKLTNVQRNSKTYWSLLNRFLNNKKIPLIPPLFHENKFVTEKGELFNSFFAKQCSLIKNSSKLPSHLHYLTDNRLSSVRFSQDGIAKIIQNLDPNKAHGHDNISIRMLKICGSSIYKPLEIIFKQCIETGIFPSEWKKANVVPIHKKGDKQTLENYRPVSLLPIYV